MSKRRYPPFSRLAKTGKWQPNHVFVIAGPNAHELARSLYKSGQCQPAYPIPENITPSLYKWQVDGKDVTVKNLGTSVEFAEALVYELLKAGAKLVVHVESESGHISIHRPEEFFDVA
jgi:hypothetical protein